MKKRILVLGNAGSGKTSLARRLARKANTPVLSLDDITWRDGTERRSPEECVAELHAFIQMHEAWIIEGCYATLVQAALPACTELRFLNPGVEVCLANCRRRPWEAEKFDSPQAQDAMLETLLQWVRTYASRDDEFGLKQHRAVLDAFEGCKHEYTLLQDYDTDPAEFTQT